jgi:hypothetical protein
MRTALAASCGHGLDMIKLSRSANSKQLKQYLDDDELTFDAGIDK